MKKATCCPSFQDLPTCFECFLRMQLKQIYKELANVQMYLDLLWKEGTSLINYFTKYGIFSSYYSLFTTVFMSWFMTVQIVLYSSGIIRHTETKERHCFSNQEFLFARSFQTFFLLNPSPKKEFIQIVMKATKSRPELLSTAFCCLLISCTIL